MFPIYLFSCLYFFLELSGNACDAVTIAFIFILPHVPTDRNGHVDTASTIMNIWPHVNKNPKDKLGRSVIHVRTLRRVEYRNIKIFHLVFGYSVHTILQFFCKK